MGSCLVLAADWLMTDILACAGACLNLNNGRFIYCNINRNEFERNLTFSQGGFSCLILTSALHITSSSLLERKPSPSLSKTLKQTEETAKGLNYFFVSMLCMFITVKQQSNKQTKQQEKWFWQSICNLSHVTYTFDQRQGTWVHQIQKDIHTLPCPGFFGASTQSHYKENRTYIFVSLSLVHDSMPRYHRPSLWSQCGHLCSHQSN